MLLYVCTFTLNYTSVLMKSNNINQGSDITKYTCLASINQWCYAAFSHKEEFYAVTHIFMNSTNSTQSPKRGHDKWYACNLIFVQNDSVYNDIRAKWSIADCSWWYTNRQNWYTVVCILIVYIILYGIIFHEYHYIRISVLTDPLSLPARVEV